MEQAFELTHHLRDGQRWLYENTSCEVMPLTVSEAF